MKSVLDIKSLPKNGDIFYFENDKLVPIGKNLFLSELIEDIKQNKIEINKLKDRVNTLENQVKELRGED